MAHLNKDLLGLLQSLDLGYSIAEEDTLLEAARIETSAFNDLVNDRVDLIPGTKGSGKSALFRIFVDFMPLYLLSQRKVVVAHGVQAPGDPVFTLLRNISVSCQKRILSVSGASILSLLRTNIL